MDSYEDYVEYTQKLINEVKSIQFPKKVDKKVLLGFDGYIDDLFSIVDVRHSLTDYESMKSMIKWSERIRNASGSSASIERILKRQTIGGFTSNVGKSIATLCGYSGNIQLLGTFGLPNSLPIFSDILKEEKKCVLQSIGEPGKTDAYEFSDGKIMMVNFGDINTLDWNHIVENVGRESLIEYFENSSLYGIGYWAGTPHGTDIFNGLQKDIFPNLSKSVHDKYLLLDLSDLRKKSSNEIADLKDLLKKFEDYVHIVLLLNETELNSLYQAFTRSTNEKLKTNNLEEKIRLHLNLSSKIKNLCEITMLISHSSQFSTITTNKEESCVLNAYTPNPKYTTSAGDHFTAAVGYGILTNITHKLLPLIGSMTASSFVRNGNSPNIEYLKNKFNYRILSN